MNSEEFTIYGIFSEKEAKGWIDNDKFRLLMVDFLTLGPMYEVMIQVLKDEGVYDDSKGNEKFKIDIHSIFRVFTTRQFYENCPCFLNKRETQGNIKIVKVALILYTRIPPLLSFLEIRNAVVIFTLKEVEAMLPVNGLPLTHASINDLLWKIDRCVSEKLLDEWIKRCEPFLEVRIEKKLYIQAHEFLYLVCNTIPRMKFFNKIPKVPLDISRTPKFNLFYVDTGGYRTLKNPDVKIQHYMNYQYTMEKANYEGMSTQNKGDMMALKKKQKNELLHKTNAENLNEFKKLLRDQDLYVEMKTKLKNAYQMLNHSKLNGKVQIMNEFRQSQPEFVPKTEKLDQLRSSESYKAMAQRRPKHQAYNLFKKEVHFHREMVKHQEGTSSPTSLHRPLTSKPQNEKKIRIAVKRPDSSNLEKMRNMIDDEFSSFERRLVEDLSRKEGNESPSQHIYYGSSNFLNKK